MTTDMRIVQATATIFEATDDADDRFFIFGTLRSGLLWFDVVSRLSDGTKGQIRGREFFDAMMAHFGGKVKIIQGRWDRSSGLTTNLDLFNKATMVLPLEQAALVATKTGQWADDYGYSKVTINRLVPPYAIGQYEEVRVNFTR
jgi:hypothetical protein